MKYYPFFLLLSFSCSKEIKEIHYTPFSNSTIQITISDAPVDSIYIASKANTIIPRGLSKSEPLTVIKPGIYFLNMEIDRPLISQITIQEETFNVFINPHDTTRLKLRLGSKINLEFEGNNHLINEYYIKKREVIGYDDIRYPLNKNLTSQATYNSIKQSADSITARELRYLESYIASALLPEWFVEFETAEIVYSGTSFKTSIPNYNKMFRLFEGDVPEDYFNYLEEVKIDNPSALLSTSYYWFLDNYFMINLPEEIKQLSGFARSSKIRTFLLNQSKRQLSEKIRHIYNASTFSQHIRYFSDSSAIDSLAKAFGVSNYEKFYEISGSVSQRKNKVSGLMKGDTLPNIFFTNLMDSLISIRDFKDKIIYVNFWATWCKPCIKNIPELNQMIREVGDEDRIAFLNICLDSKKDKWISTVAQYELEGINLYAEGNWNKKVKSYFKIQGVPHYVIIDQNNVLVENFSDKAPNVKSKLLGMIHE